MAMPTYHQPGPRSLPESIQGESLWASLIRATVYVTNTPKGLPGLWADALRRRMSPVAELLRVAGESVKLLEVQLGAAIDSHQREQERAMAAEALAHEAVTAGEQLRTQVDAAHVLIAELAQTLREDDVVSERSRELLLARASAAILPPGL